MVSPWVPRPPCDRAAHPRTPIPADSTNLDKGGVPKHRPLFLWRSSCGTLAAASYLFPRTFPSIVAERAPPCMPLPSTGALDSG